MNAEQNAMKGPTPAEQEAMKEMRAADKKRQKDSESESEYESKYDDESQSESEIDATEPSDGAAPVDGATLVDGAPVNAAALVDGAPVEAAALVDGATLVDGAALVGDNGFRAFLDEANGAPLALKGGENIVGKGGWEGQLEMSWKSPLPKTPGRTKQKTRGPTVAHDPFWRPPPPFPTTFSPPTDVNWEPLAVQDVHPEFDAESQCRGAQAAPLGGCQVGEQEVAAVRQEPRYGLAERSVQGDANA